jgi:hypothetical protein
VHNRPYGRYPLLVRAVALQFHMFNFTGFSDQCGTFLKWQWTDCYAARRTCIDYAIGYGSYCFLAQAAFVTAAFNQDD